MFQIPKLTSPSAIPRLKTRAQGPAANMATLTTCGFSYDHVQWWYCGKSYNTSRPQTFRMGHQFLGEFSAGLPTSEAKKSLAPPQFHHLRLHITYASTSLTPPCITYASISLSPAPPMTWFPSQNAGFFLFAHTSSSSASIKHTIPSRHPGFFLFAHTSSSSASIKHTYTYMFVVVVVIVVVVAVAVAVAVAVVVVVGCWLLVAGCWLLVAGCWLLVVRCSLFVVRCWLWLLLLVVVVVISVLDAYLCCCVRPQPSEWWRKIRARCDLGSWGWGGGGWGVRGLGVGGGWGVGGLGWETWPGFEGGRL